MLGPSRFAAASIVMLWSFTSGFFAVNAPHLGAQSLVDCLGPAITPTELSTPAFRSGSVGRRNAVGLDGEVAVVPGSRCEPGALVMRRVAGTWTEEAFLVPSLVESDDDELRAKVSGDVAIVHASNGFAFVFRYSGGVWTEEQVLSPSGAAGFTGAFAIDGEVAVFASGGDLYVYRYDALMQSWNEEAVLTASGGDAFGGSVAVSGPVIMAGDSQITSGLGPTEEGVAYVYRYDGSSSWVEEAILTDTVPTTGSHFGWAVAVDGDRALVGAPALQCLNAGNCPVALGLVYAYEYDSGTQSWNLDGSFAGSLATTSDSFGYALALDGERALVSSRRLDGSFSQFPGVSYIFERGPVQGWQETTIITRDEYDDFLGISVALSGDFALLSEFGPGTPFFDGGNGDAVAHLYAFDTSSQTWSLDLQVELGASEHDIPLIPRADNLAVDGDVAIVGAHDHPGTSAASGAAAVMRRDPITGDWSTESILSASDASPDQWFGGAVGISGDVAVVGAVGDDGPFSAGAAYVYRRDSGSGDWVEEAKLLPSGPDEGFGQSVSVLDDVIVVAASRAPFGEPVAFYVFRFDPLSSAWNEEAVLQDPMGSHTYSPFYNSVALDADLLVVGITLAFGEGAVVVYRRDPLAGTWSQEAELTAAMPFEALGRGVAVQGDVLAAAGESGVHIYRFDSPLQTWTLETVLSLPPEIRAIGLAGERLFVSGRQSGQIHLYRNEAGSMDWVELGSLDLVLGPDATVDGAAASGDTAAVAYRDGSCPTLGATVQFFDLDACAPPFIRGDANGDGGIDVADPIASLSALFDAGAIPCPDAMDANGDDTIDLADPIYALGFIFSGGPAFPPPYPACGIDDNLDTLEACSFPACP